MKGEFNRATADFDEAIALDPKNADAFESVSKFGSKRYLWFSGITKTAEIRALRSADNGSALLRTQLRANFENSLLQWSAQVRCRAMGSFT